MFPHLTKGQTAATSKENASPSSSSFPPCAFSFGTLLLCAWPHQKPSQMFTSCLPGCLRFLCFFFLLFCFCFSIIVVLASFITPYFMLVLAFCLLLSFRLWIVVKFFVIINFFFFWRVFRVFVFCFLKAVCAKDCGFRWVWFRRWGKMVKWFRHQHHLALLLLLIKILILVDWFRYMLPTEMQGPKTKKKKKQNEKNSIKNVNLKRN